jgi:hypothetical protein
MHIHGQAITRMMPLQRRRCWMLSIDPTGYHLTTIFYIFERSDRFIHTVANYGHGLSDDRSADFNEEWTDKWL